MNPRYLRLIDPLINSLVEFELKHLQEQEDSLILHHVQRGGDANGFMYLGKRYTKLPHHKLRGYPFKSIHESLFDDLQYHVSRFDTLKRNVSKIKQALTVVLPRCNNFQDIRDVLPEVFINDVPRLKQFERTREEGFLLKDSPVLLKQYQAAIKLAEWYTANKFLY